MDVAAGGLSVLVADKFEASGLEGLRAAGCAVRSDPDLTAATLEQALRELDPDVLVVRGTKVTTAALRSAARLSLVVRAGAGYDTIDVETASARGIFVANCPGKNAIAVAELTWGLILACDRRLADQAADLRRGLWKKKEYARAAGIYGRTLGIVGLGEIGCEVAARGRAFGMKVVAWSRSLTEERALAMGAGYCSNLVNLAKVSDVVSVHVAATPDTQGLIGEKFCAALKPGSIVVNTSRGSVVDQAALTRAVRDKGVRLGLDVFASEPSGAEGTFDDPIVQEPGVIGTHHVGASTDQAQQAIAAEVVRIVDTYQRAGTVLNCVNRATATPATMRLTVRHLNRPGVLAHVFYTLGQAGINVEEMENVIYDGARAACARIQLDEPASDEHLNAIRANADVLSVAVTRIQRRRAT
jgi:D-3-phosphoglycerate dehydrogenase